MAIIDSQVHVYEANTPKRPWHSVPNWPASATGDEMVAAMDKVDMGGHTLLDETVVFFGSELQNPPTHKKNDMPFLLAGAGGGLRGGRWVKYAGLPHNNLLVSILNLFGDPRQTFGDGQYCTGPLTNIV